MCRLLAYCILALIAVFIVACGKKNYLNENDALRARALQQQTQIDDLNRRNAELRTQLEALSAAPGEISEEIQLATPHVTELTIDRLSHVRRNAGEPAKLLLYLSSVDGRGRFTQLVGSVEVSVFLLPMSAEPTTIGRLTAAPLQVRDAYRHTLMSTHYTFEVPLDLPPSAADSGDSDSVFVRALYTDGHTGRHLTAEASLKPD